VERGFIPFTRDRNGQKKAKGQFQIERFWHTHESIIADAGIKARYAASRFLLDERARRLLAAAERVRRLDHEAYTYGSRVKGLMRLAEPPLGIKQPSAFALLCAILVPAMQRDSQSRVFFSVVLTCYCRFHGCIPA
jgi:hypothetical protein